MGIVAQKADYILENIFIVHVFINHKISFYWHICLTCILDQSWNLQCEVDVVSRRPHEYQQKS